MSKAWMLVIALGVAPLPIYLWVLDGLAAELLFDIAVAAILTVGGVAAWRLPRHRAAWVTIIAGHWMFLAGDITFTVNAEVLGREAFPSEGDVFYLAGYVVIALGLLGLLRAQAPGRDLGGVVDGAIVAIGVGVLLWVLVMAPTMGEPDLTMLERIVTVSYPAGDLLLLTVGAQLAMSRIRRLVPLWLLAASITIMLAGDLGYLRAIVLDTYESGGLLDAAWWIAYVLIVAAVVHPRAVELADAPTTRIEPRLRPSRLLVLAVAILASPVLLAVRGAEGSWAGAPALLGSTMVMFVLVVLRLVLVNRELAHSREQLWLEAHHDSLTGLANRSLFAEHLERSLSRRRTTGHAAVLFIDLDDFKMVNDSLGHPTGDELLRAISDRLREIVRPEDVVARLGGDEFAVLLDHTTPADAELVAGRIIESIRLPVEARDDLTLRTNASVGITFGGPDDSVHAVLRDADTAMYLAKSNGKGRFAVFRPGMRQSVMERLELRDELVEALARGEMVLHYQPIIDLVAGRITGAEALLRWDHPIRGFVQPDSFIPIAEETGLIVDIGAWTIHEACRQARIWQAGPDGIDVFVNLSAQQLCDPGLLDVVRHALDTSGLPAHRLVLELTEATVIDHLRETAARLRDLRELGVRVALDDFGAGSTSVAHLGAFPLDVLKFDRSFVTASFDSTVPVLRALVSLANGMGIATVAEGIETDEQLEVIATTGCGYVQGFRFSAAVSPSAFDVLLSDGSPGWPTGPLIGPASVTT